jgi:hypothetical protein
VTGESQVCNGVSAAHRCRDNQVDILKSRLLIVFISKYTRALTFEHWSSTALDNRWWEEEQLITNADWLVWLLRELESEEALAVMGRDHESKVASQNTIAG